MRGPATESRPRKDLRSWIRPLVPRVLYHAGHRALNAAAALRFLGPAEALALMSSPREGELLELHPRNLQHAFVLAGDRWARRSFTDVVLRELYRIGVSVPSGGVIVDGGAHTGDSAVWLLSRHPLARVVAVEPLRRNHELLVTNSAPYGDRVTVVRAALWGEKAELALVDRGASTGARTVESASLPGGGESVRALTVDGLMEETGIETIDLLKLDVEGAEESLFAAPGADRWLERTHAVAVELHGPAAHDAVLPVLARHGFAVRRHRELHVATR